MNQIHIVTRTVMAVTLFTAMGAFGASAQTVFWVTNNNDTGPGSLREAIEDATPGPRTIKIAFWVNPITTQAPLVYTSRDPLTILGKGLRKRTIRAGFDGVGTDNLLELSNGADLKLVNLTLADAPQNNIRLEVPGDRTGTVHVELVDLIVKDSVGNEGLSIIDSDAPVASVKVRIIDCLFLNSGDQNVSITERGEGDLAFWTSGSSFLGADQRNVMLREGGGGNLHVNASRSRFTDSTNNLGLDVAERDSGDLWLDIRTSEVDRNGVQRGGANEGIRAREDGAGSVYAKIVDVSASGNTAEGIDLRQGDGGDIHAFFRNVKTDGNGGGSSGHYGVEIKNTGSGDIDLVAVRLKSRGNILSGLSIDGQESVEAYVSRSILTNNGNFGVEANSATNAGQLTVLLTALGGNTNGEVDSNLPSNIFP